MMSVMAFTSAQAPAKTGRAREEELAAHPEGQSNHQAAADQAEPPHVVQRPLGERLNRPEKPIIRNAKPRMSANPAKLFSGRVRAMIPKAASSTPKITHNHLTALLSEHRRDEFLGSEHQEHDPLNTPAAMAEAWSNFNTTTAIVTQGHPQQQLHPPVAGDLPQERAAGCHPGTGCTGRPFSARSPFSSLRHVTWLAPLAESE
jgi:hypothetical protein